jgi:hypothetical protein
MHQHENLDGNRHFCDFLVSFCDSHLRLNKKMLVIISSRLAALKSLASFVPQRLMTNGLVQRLAPTH